MTGIDDIAQLNLQDPGCYMGIENTSKGKLEGGIGRYLKIVGGPHGGLYKIIRTSVVGKKFYGEYRVDQFASWGENNTVDAQMFTRLKGIEWGHIADPANRLSDISKFAKGDLSSEIVKIAGKVASAWPDQSGAFAAAKLKQLADVCCKYGDSANVLAAAIGAPGGGLHDSTMAKIDALVQFCNKTSDAFLTYMEGRDVQGLLQRLRSIEMFLSVGVDASRDPFTLENMVEPGHKIYRPTFGDNWYSDVELNNLIAGFANPYRESVSAFRIMIRDVYDSINQQMASLVHITDDSGSPFDALKSDPPKPEPKSAPNPGGGAGGGGSGGGGSYGGGGGGTSAASTYTPPPSSYTPNISATPDIDATATPDLSTTSGLTSASSVAPVVDSPETVTIKDGDRQIAVQSPDGQGHVKVTIDDGSGKPKSYDMDFGDSPTQARGGATGLRQGDDAAEDPTKATGEQPSEGDAEPAKAGADGKVVMHDGDLTITAERPDGMPDQLKVTVDDGSGHPSTYNIDYQDGSTDPTQPDAPDAKQPDGTAAPATHNGVNGNGHGGAATGSGGATDSGHAAPTHQDMAQPAHSGAGTAAVASDITTPQGNAVPPTADGPPGSASFAGDHGPRSGADDPGVVHPAGPGDAQLATAPDGSAPNGATGQQGGMAGMPMMGGGMGGGGGGGGGDGQRGGGSNWRTTGNLFDDDFSAAGRPDGTDGFDEELEW